MISLCGRKVFLTEIVQDLEQLAAELRVDIVHSVSKTGGHLSASLGVVELAVALHHVFNTPEDKIIWDVGHQVRRRKLIGEKIFCGFDFVELCTHLLVLIALQAYPHKILTGRRSRMHTMRQTSGLAGFPKRDESDHDAFGAGHSSTSISAGLGEWKLFVCSSTTFSLIDKNYVC